MARMALQDVRAGITPVVAIVLLLMMTVAVAGGAYAWMQGIIGDRMAEGEFKAGTEMNVRGLQCGNTSYGNAFVGQVTSFTIQNTGDTNVDSATVNVFVDDQASGDLAAQGSTSGTGGTFESGEVWTGGPVNLSANLTSADRYDVTFSFPNSYSVEVTGSCQAE